MFARSNRLDRALIAVALAVTGAGCSDPVAPAPPYAARLAVPGRDAQLTLNSFDRTRTKLYLSRLLVQYDVWNYGRSNRLVDLSALDLKTFEQRPVASRVNWFAQLPGTDGTPLLLIRQDTLDQGAPATLTLLNPDTGESQDVDHVVPESVGWSDARVVFIRDLGVRRELWAGSFESVRAVSGDRYIHDWAWLGPETVAVTAGPTPDASDGHVALAELGRPIGIESLDIDTGEGNELFPAHIDDAEWAGPGPAPELAYDGIAANYSSEGSVVARLQAGCWSPSASRALNASDRQCYLLYVREAADGTTRSFLGLPEQKREIAFADAGSLDFITSGSWSRMLPYLGNAPMAAWSVRDAHGEAPYLQIWQAETGTARRCDIAGDGGYGLFSGRDDGRILAYGNGAAFTMISADREDCAVIDVEQTSPPVFAGDGERMVWTNSDELWEGAIDGSGVRRVLAGATLSALRFRDDHRLLALRDSPDGSGLSWFDIDEEAPREHPLVEQIFLSGYSVGSHSLLIGSGYSAQDNTGSLTLVDLDSGGIETLADSIGDYAVGWPPSDGSDAFPFAYARIGRFASERDGIWLGWIPRSRVDSP